MEIKKLKFERRLSRGKSSVVIAIPKVFLELMKAEKCRSVYVSITDLDHLSLEVIRND